VPFEEISYDLNLVGVTDIFLDDYAWYGYTVSGVSIRTDSGTSTVTFKIDSTQTGAGTSIGGLTSLTAGTSGTQGFSTSSYTVPQYGQLRITVTGTSGGATRLYGSIKINRT
jgi:hypothetical protein